MCSDLVSTSQFCALFSATGILFMSFIGTLLIKQPFFILGIDNIENAKGSAFGAAGTFFVTFLISILYLIYDGQKRSKMIAVSTSSTNGHPPYRSTIQLITSRNFASSVSFQQQQTNRFGEYASVSFEEEEDIFVTASANDNDVHYDNNELHYA